MRCDQCGTRLDGDPFTYRDRSFCCSCMAVLCSWLLDGGFRENPELFPWLLVTD
jgi:hypothetical protein